MLLIGNGDVKDLEDARAKATETGCDGIMFGRAMFGNPWVFEGISGRPTSPSEVGRPTSNHGLDEKLEALIELAYGFEKLSPPKSFAILKKHIKAFVIGFPACAGRPGAADLRAELMSASSAAEFECICAFYNKKEAPKGFCKES